MSETWKPRESITRIDREESPARINYLDGTYEWVPLRLLDIWAKAIECSTNEMGRFGLPTKLHHLSRELR